MRRIVGGYLAGATLSLALQLSVEDVCPLPGAPTAEEVNSGSAAAKTLMYKPKTCPDFKDDADQVACCPSQITPGAFYCCTLERQAELASQLAAEARRQFFKNYLAVIVISAIALTILLFAIATILCKRLSFCPLYESKSAFDTPRTMHFPSRYRPVESTIHKPPAVYEAPPPYEFSTAPMTQLPTAPPPVCHEDWNYLVQNEVNDRRQHLSGSRPASVVPFGACSAPGL
ncbi:Protein R05C11.4 [Aphelenchoides avenae]|nr:Protein R05C11.4 [Aphelenchus avenae]